MSEVVQIQKACKAPWLFWQNMIRVKKIYEAEYTGYYEPTLTGYTDSFDCWLEKKFGIHIEFDKRLQVISSFDIVDPTKYTFYLLRHT